MTPARDVLCYVKRMHFTATTTCKIRQVAGLSVCFVAGFILELVLMWEGCQGERERTNLTDTGRALAHGMTYKLLRHHHLVSVQDEEH